MHTQLCVGVHCVVALRRRGQLSDGAAETKLMWLIHVEESFTGWSTWLSGPVCHHPGKNKILNDEAIEWWQCTSLLCDRWKSNDFVGMGRNGMGAASRQWKSDVRCYTRLLCDVSDSGDVSNVVTWQRSRAHKREIRGKVARRWAVSSGVTHQTHNVRWLRLVHEVCTMYSRLCQGEVPVYRQFII